MNLGLPTIPILVRFHTDFIPIFCAIFADDSADAYGRLGGRVRTDNPSVKCGYGRVDGSQRGRVPPPRPGFLSRPSCGTWDHGPRCGFPSWGIKMVALGKRTQFRGFIRRPVYRCPSRPIVVSYNIKYIALLSSSQDSVNCVAVIAIDARVPTTLAASLSLVPRPHRFNNL